jgi:L-ascorbate metabolism protein UlaG (beta-lactamase superfamily)
MAGFQGSEAPGGKVSLSFRWLGAAGVELKAGGQVLALDPFFTRPSLPKLFHPINPDASLAASKLPVCQYVLVTHAHYDHLLDIPAVQQHTGADAYGSPNTCQLLQLLDVPAPKLHVIHPGDRLDLGEFKVEVVAGRHSWIPFSRIFNGRLRPGLHPPLRAQDYRMDVCLGYRITVMGIRLLVCAAEPQPADVLFVVAQEPKAYYQRMLRGVQPHTLVPIHWDDFTRPLDQPLTRFTRPGRMPLAQLDRLAHQAVPGVNVIVPEPFKEYLLEARPAEIT